MRFAIETAVLASGLSACGRVIGKSQIPVIQCVRIEAGTDVELRGTNFNIEISRRISAAIYAPGAACVDYGRMSAWVSALIQGSQIEAELSGMTLALRSGRASLKLPIIEAVDFPSFPAIDGAVEFEIPSVDFVHLLSTGSVAEPEGSTRYYFAGVHLVRSGEKLRGEATNGHVLLRFHVSLPAGADQMPEGGIIVPVNTAKALTTCFKEDASISLAVSPEQIVASAGSLVFRSKLVDGSFPETDRFVPPFDLTAAFDAVSLAGALKRVAPGIDDGDKSSTARVTLYPQELTLSARSKFTEEAQDSIEAMGPPEPLPLGVNVRNIASALGALDCDTIEMSVAREFGSPILFRPAGNPDRMAMCDQVRV